VELDALFEGFTPLARRLRAAGPYGSQDSLIERARELVDELGEEEKIATLNAHPRLGEDPARLSAHSLREQGTGALPELDRLQAEYEARFGFRFVVFVNRRPKSELVEVLRYRLKNDRDEELCAGLRAVVDIAEDRLHTA
jgi:2-oxo-4-hydroxy-4-carboxy--5-ureidoimidazoline (OHCU) decarboxylase